MTKCIIKEQFYVGFDTANPQSHCWEILVITMASQNLQRLCRWYRVGVGNTVEENSGVFSLIRMH